MIKTTIGSHRFSARFSTKVYMTLKHFLPALDFTKTEYHMDTSVSIHMVPFNICINDANISTKHVEVKGDI